MILIISMPLILSAALAALLGAGISAVAGLVTSAVNRSRMSKAEKESMDYEDSINDENADLAYIRQREFQESYLTPEAQLKSQAAGMDAIGLNRMLIGGNTAGSTGSVQQSSGTSGAAPRNASPLDVSGLITGISSLVQARADAEFKQGQLDVNRQLMDSELKRRAAETEGIEIENSYKAELASANIRKLNADADNMTANKRLVESKGVGQDIINTYLPDRLQATINLDRANASLSETQKRLVEQKVLTESKLREKMDAEIATMVSHRNLMVSQAALSDEQALGIAQQMEESQKRIELYGKQMGLTDKEIKWYGATKVFQYIRQTASSAADVIGAVKGIPLPTSRPAPAPDTYTNQWY